MTDGYLAIVLHAHLPYVWHDQEGELPEDWFYEACTETYLPLLEMMNRLVNRGVDFRLTISISPTLASMLADQLLQKRYEKHLLKMLELAEKEIDRTVGEPEFNHLARMYREQLSRASYLFADKYNHDLLQAFRSFQEIGRLELITSAATHGYLPLILTEEALKAQIETGVKVYQDYFQTDPAGIWLPECGYKPGLDKILAAYNLRYFICSSHGLLYAVPRPRYGLYAPIYTPAGVAAFGRDTESSKQVWSSDEGYPGDFDYREFYRDIGYDLDYDYLKDYLPGGIRKHTGFKYYRVTGREDEKQPYNPEWGRARAAEHAGNFLFNRQQQLKYLNQILDRKPLIVAPYDAELFGHWWFEGPQFLEYLFEKIHYDQEEVALITLPDYLELYSKNQVAVPSESSWGYQGYHEVWLNSSNDWIYRHLHQAEIETRKMADRYLVLKDKKSILYRALNQLCRELLLAQSSDWAFIMKTGTLVDYAVERTRSHLNHFWKLLQGIEKGEIDQDFLKKMERQTRIFPGLDFKIYNSREKALRKEG